MVDSRYFQLLVKLFNKQRYLGSVPELRE